MDETLRRIVELIGPKRGAAKDLAEYLGFNPNVITNWKNGRNKSYLRYLPEIAEFYGTTVEYLEGKTNEKSSAPENSEQSIEAILEEARKKLEAADSLMFDGGVATPEAIDSVLKAMEVGMQLAKERTDEEKARAAKIKADILRKVEEMDDQ